MKDTNIVVNDDVGQLTDEDRKKAFVLWFDQLRRKDVNLVGGKSSSLGELTSGTNVPVPYGYAYNIDSISLLHENYWLP